MAYLPRLPGETDTAWDLRMFQVWAARQPAVKRPDEMDPAEQAAALDALSRPAPRLVVMPFEGRHLRDMSPHERAAAAQQLGVAHLYTSFR